MRNLLEHLESRRLMSAAPTPTITADQAAVTTDMAKIVADKAALKTQVAAAKATFASTIAVTDTAAILNARAILVAGPGIDPYVLLQDKQAVVAANAQFKSDKATLASQIQSDTYTSVLTVANDNAQLAYDKAKLSADQIGRFTTAVANDLSNILTVTQQINQDQWSLAEQILAAQPDGGKIAADHGTLLYDMFHIQLDALSQEAAGTSPDPDGQLTMDRRIIWGYQDVIAADYAAVRQQTKADTAATQRIVGSDNAQLKVDKKQLAHDLSASGLVIG